MQLLRINFSDYITERASIPNECKQYQDDNENIYAVFTVNVKKGADINIGNENEKPKSKSVKMCFYESDGKIEPIPLSDDPDSLMHVTATRSTGDCALVVEEYYKITEDDNILYCEQYDKSLDFGYTFLNKSDSPAADAKKKPKTVAYVAKLKAPFIVKVMKEKPE